MPGRRRGSRSEPPPEVSVATQMRELGKRYLIEGRLAVLHVDKDRISAASRGNHNVYRLGFDQSRGWWCSCPSSGMCHHLAALQLVTAVPGSGQSGIDSLSPEGHRVEPAW